MNTDHFYAVIMAGGSGSRLWPLSRSAKPKQFQTLVGEETLVQGMYKQVAAVLKASQIFVMAAPQFEPLVRQQLPDLPADNFLYEPSPKDNGPAFILAAAEIKAKDPEAVIGVFWSDHIIRQAEEFGRVISTAFQAAAEHPQAVVGVGVKPTFPDTGLGYIKMGKGVGWYSGTPVFEVDQAIEKPDIKRAEKFAASWEYLWNTGYKFFKAETITEAFRKFYPDMADALDAIEMALGTPEEKTAIDEAWQRFPKESIDKLLIEKLENALVVPADLGWSDIGNWKTLHDVLSSDDATVISRGQHLSEGDTNVLAYGQDKLIVTLGLSDIVVVETEDAILVAHKSRAQDIKKIVERLKAEGKESYL